MGAMGAMMGGAGGGAAASGAASAGMGSTMLNAVGQGLMAAGGASGSAPAAQVSNTTPQPDGLQDKSSVRNQLLLQALQNLSR